MKPTAGQIEGIGELTGGRVQLDVPLSRFTSFKIGGPADVIVRPGNTRELSLLLEYLHREKISRYVLGAGTNVLFHDAGFRGVVVHTAGLDAFSLDSNGSDWAIVTVAAGVLLPSVISRSCREGFSGLEPLWGIPGSFGGAVSTNAGAAGTSIGDFLQSATLMSESGQQSTLSGPDLKYGYRYFELPPGSAVVEGTLRLRRGDPDPIEAALKEARDRRRATQPMDLPCAGCVFKNPSPDNPAGAIIDRLGFKGVTIGGAAVSERHANFIVNRGRAVADDVLKLIDRIRDRVKQEAGIDLELEIRIVGEQANEV